MSFNPEHGEPPTAEEQLVIDMEAAVEQVNIVFEEAAAMGIEVSATLTDGEVMEHTVPVVTLAFELTRVLRRLG